MAAVTAELDLEISRLRQKLGQANSRLDKFAADARKKGSTFASNFHAGMGNLLKGGLAGLAVGAGVAGLLAGKTFSDSIKAAMDDEQFGVSVEVLVGDAGRAKDLIAQLRKDAASTPLSFGDLGGAAKQLLAFGEDAESVPSTLRRIGDVSTAIQAPIGEIAEIYGKARVQGTLFAEDINQLTGRGIPVIQEFARQLGVGESQVKKMGSEGKITFDMLQKAFVDLTSEGGKFGGMMERQAGTLGGLWSTFLDNIQELRLEFGKPIAESLKPILEDGIGLLETMKVKAAEWGQAIATGIDYARAAFQELSGGEALDLAGEALQLAFMKAVNALARGLNATFLALKTSDLGKALDQELERAAKKFKDAMLDGLMEVLRAFEGNPLLEKAARDSIDAIEASRSGGRAAEAARGVGKVGNGSTPDPTFFERFQRFYQGSSSPFETSSLEDSIRNKMFAVDVQKSLNQLDRMAEAGFARAEAEMKGPSPQEEKKVAGRGSRGSVSMQDAVNSLFGRSMDADVSRIASAVDEMNRTLRRIENQNPPQVPAPLPAGAAFAPY